MSSISCSSPGNCTAVGSYDLRHERYSEGLLLTERAGHWATGVEAVLPEDAASDPQVSLTSVSCASAGNCTAVGTYGTNPKDVYSEGGFAGLLLTEKAGHWAPGVEAVLPGEPPEPADPEVQLHSVSCASAGNCTAVGSYYSYGYEGLLLTEKAGHWAPGVAIAGGQYGFGADITSVSCSPDGSCGAVGYFKGGEDFRAGLINGTGLLLSKKAGTWSEVSSELVWPAGGPGEAAILSTVSCASAGNCSATAQYDIGIDYEDAGSGALFTEKAGVWRRGVTAKPPLKSTQSTYWLNYVGLAGISCGSSGYCSAVGTYYHRKRPHLTLLTEKAGKWRRGVEAAMPRGARNPNGAAISCASPGNCAVVGYYGLGIHGKGAGQHGLLLTEIAGRWAGGVRAPRSTVYVSSVSCSSPGDCEAVGGDSRGNGILLDSTTQVSSGP